MKNSNLRWNINLNLKNTRYRVILCTITTRYIYLNLCEFVPEVRRLGKFPESAASEKKKKGEPEMLGCAFSKYKTAKVRNSNLPAENARGPGFLEVSNVSK